MDSAILQMITPNCVKVSDHLSDRTISSSKFFDSCFRHMRKVANVNKKDKKACTNLKSNLYSVMNDNKSLAKSSSNSSNIPRELQETWVIEIDDVCVELNMKKLGAEELALSVIEKFKSTFLINKETSLISEEITEILICSDAVLFEYLEPLLYNYSREKIQITFMDLDCACLGASFLAYSNLSTIDMVPFPIGMGMYNGVIKPLISSKSNYPCSGKYVFQTIVDKQAIIRVNLYEGNSPLARNCKHICELRIENSNLTQNFRSKIELTIELNEYGKLKANAQDLSKKDNLKLTLDFLPNAYLEFIRGISEKPVNINLKIDPETFKDEKNLANFLDDLDFYLDYLLNVYKYTSETTRKLVMEKILSTKKFLSKNRLRVNFEDCDKLVVGLENIVKTHQAYDENNTQIKSVDRYNKSTMCNIL